MTVFACLDLFQPLRPRPGGLTIVGHRSRRFEGDHPALLFGDRFVGLRQFQIGRSGSRVCDDSGENAALLRTAHQALDIDSSSRHGPSRKRR